MEPVFVERALEGLSLQWDRQSPTERVFQPDVPKTDPVASPGLRVLLASVRGMC